MSDQAALLADSFRVGKRTVTMTMPQPEMGKMLWLACEWAPTPPTRGLTKKELRQYRAGRDAFFRRVASITGMRALLVEV